MKQAYGVKCSLINHFKRSGTALRARLRAGQYPLGGPPGKAVIYRRRRTELTAFTPWTAARQPLSAALDHSGLQRSPTCAKSAPRARCAALSSSDREPVRIGALSGNSCDYSFKRETPTRREAGIQLTADQERVRGGISGSALGRLGELISGQNLRTSNVLRTRSSSDGSGCGAPVRIP